MTSHDRARFDRAYLALSDPQAEMDAIMEAIGGIQSTDDPGGPAIEEQLWIQWRKLKQQQKDAEQAEREHLITFKE